MHRHGDLELVFHPRGAGRTCNPAGEALTFAPGDVVLYPPHTFHNQVMDQPGEDCCVQIALPEGAAAIFHTWRCMRVEDAYARNELHLLAHAAPPRSATEQQVYDLRVTALLTHLLAAAPPSEAQSQSAGDRLAERAHRHIAEHCTTLASLDDAATACDCSPDRLRHVFTQRYGISMARWLSECRMERAKELLLHTPLDLCDIAQACGYGSVQAFSACFRRVIGTSPGSWRLDPSLRR